MKPMMYWALPDWTTLKVCYQIEVSFTIISSNLLIWVYTKANGESGIAGGTGGRVNPTPLNLKVPCFLNPSTYVVWT